MNVIPFPLRRNLGLLNRFVEEYRAIRNEHGQAKANEYDRRFMRRQFNRLKRLGISPERIRHEMVWFTIEAVNEANRRYGDSLAGKNQG